MTDATDRARLLEHLRRSAPQRADKCANCGLHTSLRRTRLRRIWPGVSDNEVLPGGPCAFERLLTCSHCSKTTVEFLIYAADHAEGVLGDVAPDETRQVWPERPPRGLAASAPEAMRSLFVEASVAEAAGALRGAAVLYRAAVEELVKDQGASGRDLKAKIESLRGKVEDELVEDLHEARLLGNWSIHEALTFSAEEVADVAELIVEAVHVLYVEPAERRALRDARKARRDAHNAT